ncbi:hypothetical protein OHA98_14590 [Streptomyces sp. NBC_00654]|uniref:hypothetical protein n=1 Tax=Streptomyces sp. NBC_00654 TaxID=2975799 RepID=UPI002255E697|nr:hypothetical protein [Streptomyces sp. NBC_00654]MCX4966050.1 hypothetical protein [Streptomyces sp. NBC_00654]
MATAAVVAEPRAHPSAVRFAEDIVRLHRRLSFAGLPDAVGGQPLYLRESRDGDLLTLAVRESQLPRRYVLGIQGFRLAQFLERGWVCRSHLHRLAAFHEPLRPPHPVDDVHVVALSPATGKILGYTFLAGSLDAEPLPLDSPARARLSVERDHGLDLLGRAAAPGWTTHRVYEAKRQLRAAGMPRGVLATRIPWHVMAGMGRSLLALGGPRGRVMVAGDAKEGGSFRHLELMGLDLDIVHGPPPNVPRTDLFWPLFDTDLHAKPFLARLPGTFAGDMGAIEGYLADADDDRSIRVLMEERAASREARR